MRESTKQEPLAYTVKEVMELSRIGRTKFYELIKSGKIRTKKIGAKHLVPVDELKRFMRGEDAA
jgi:excisionase family DNA binding protein